jgi:hypothetical protein
VSRQREARFDQGPHSWRTRIATYAAHRQRPLAANSMASYKNSHGPVLSVPSAHAVYAQRRPLLVRLTAPRHVSERAEARLHRALEVARSAPPPWSSPGLAICGSSSHCTRRGPLVNCPRALLKQTVEASSTEVALANQRRRPTRGATLRLSNHMRL